MKQLNQTQIQDVSAGTTSGDIAFALSTAWASTVIGAALGSPVIGIGTVVGGAIGLTVGVGMAVGYILAQ